MRILQVNKYLKPRGGSETYMFQLAESLIENGHEVKFWGMQDEENSVGDFPKLNIPFIDYKSQTTFQKYASVISSVYSVSNKIRIGKILDVFKPDIVHLHNYNFQITPSILPEIKKRGIKIVQTVHDSQMVCPYHRLYNFQKNEVCTKCVEGSFLNCIKDRCFDGSLLKSSVGAVESLFYHGFKFYDKYIDTYIFPSHFLADLVGKKVHSKFEIIPNFTNAVFDETLNHESNPYYLYYGRISEEKGIKKMIEIFQKAALPLVIIGKGEIETEVENIVATSDTIRFLGHKTGKELFEYVQNAKYVVQFSQLYENCPMTIVESYALQVPVLAVNHSGFKELITNGQTGFLFDLEDPDAAVKKLLQIDSLPTDTLQKDILTFYNQNLSKQNHINKVMNLYGELLSK